MPAFSPFPTKFFTLSSNAKQSLERDNYNFPSYFDFNFGLDLVFLVIISLNFTDLHVFGKKLVTCLITYTLGH